MSAPTPPSAEHDGNEAMSTRQLQQLPETAKCVTNAVFTSGNRVRQGWRDGKRYFETFHYPGALNFQEIVELPSKPEWAR